MELKHLGTYKNARQLAQAELKSIVQNKEINIEERWRLFKEHGEDLAEHYIFIYRPEVMPEELFDYLFDGDNISRHQTVTVEGILDILSDFMEDKDYITIKTFDDNYNKVKKDIYVGKEMINALKEEFMEDFIWSFEYDW